MGGLPLDVRHQAERGNEAQKREQRRDDKAADQEQQSDGERERHPEDGTDSRNENVGWKSFKHEASTMLATGETAHNAAADRALQECLDDVLPVLDSRRLALIAAWVLAFVSLLGVVPLHSGIGFLLAAMSATAVIERRLVMRASTPAQVRGVLFGGAIAYCTYIVGLLFYTSDMLWIGVLALALTLAASASLLSGRQLAAAAAYPGMLVSLFFLGVSADVIRPLTLLAANRPAPALTVLADGSAPLAAVVAAFISIVGLPMLVVHTYVSAKRLRVAREELRRASSDLIDAEQVVVESREQLHQWNDQLNAEVRAKTAELEEQNRYLSAINAVSFALSGPVEHDGISERTCELIARILGMSAAQLHVESLGALIPDVFVIAGRRESGLAPIRPRTDGTGCH